MSFDKKVICYGLGATDPRRVFYTTEDLLEKFGNERVFDIPTSENAMTGIGIGLANLGSKVIFSHQRVDFSFLSMDQIINSMSKWYYMFGGQKPSNNSEINYRKRLGSRSHSFTKLSIFFCKDSRFKGCYAF